MTDKPKKSEPISELWKVFESNWQDWNRSRVSYFIHHFGIALNDLKLENEELRRELQGIISKCEWYATVHQGPDHEIHHALKVEIPEEARAALKNGGGE